MLFAYAMRSLVARRATILPTVLVITAAVGVITALFAGLEGLKHAVRDDGDLRSGMVISRGRDEVGSQISRSNIERVAVLDGLAKGNGGATLVSPELRYATRLVLPDLEVESIDVRGVDLIAFEVHPMVKMRSGIFPPAASRGVAIGRRLAGRWPGLEIGSELAIGRHRWPIVGIFDAEGSRFESEVWCDRSDLVSELHTAEASILAFDLERPQALAALASAVEHLRDEPLEALSDRQYAHRMLAHLDVYLETVDIVILLLVVGAVFATTNTIYSAFLERVRELATLLAMGYRRRQVALIVLLESALLSAACSLVGVVSATLARGMQLSNQEVSLIYSALFTPRVLLAGFSFGLLIGVFGGAVSVVQVMRLRILSALREG